MKELKEEFERMIASLAVLDGGAPLEGLCATLRSTAPSVAVRVNRRKGLRPADGARCPAWSAGLGVYVGGGRPRFTFDPALHQGRYYVQDASSMAVADVVLRLTAGVGPVVCLDACAAPGGKTTAVIDALPEGSLVIANEWDPRRAEVLKENVLKWGSCNVAVSRGDTAALRRLGPMADIAVVDAPCSGEGMMRKDDTAVEQWSEALVESCAALQRAIIADVWEALKPGGHIIYSTCTFNRRENEENVEWMTAALGAENIPTGLNGYGGVSGAVGSSVEVSRFIPGIVDGEGLFMAVLRKPGAPVPAKPRKDKGRRRTDPKDQALLNVARGWVTGDVTLRAQDGVVTALPTAWLPEIGKAAAALDIISAGTPVGTVKGRDLIPSQPLALSDILADGAFARVEADYRTAIACLRGDSLTLGEGVPRGVVLLTYGGYPLAFVKNLGNRANNLYPKAWAIHSTYVPDMPPALPLRQQK